MENHINFITTKIASGYEFSIHIKSKKVYFYLDNIPEHDIYIMALGIMVGCKMSDTICKIVEYIHKFKKDVYINSKKYKYEDIEYVLSRK